MGQLVGVQDRPHGHNDSLGDLERRHPHDAAVRAVEDEPRLDVDERR